MNVGTLYGDHLRERAVSAFNEFFMTHVPRCAMKTITIRELHLQTGRWVRHAAAYGPVVVTDRGRPVAALQATAAGQGAARGAAPTFDGGATRRLPDRESAILKRPRIPVDSGIQVEEDRDDSRSPPTRDRRLLAALLASPRGSTSET